MCARLLGHSALIERKNPSGVARAFRFETEYAIDEEYKKYSFKRKVLKNGAFPGGDTESWRRVEGNWKSQYKVNKQYNIHTHQKDSKTIRKLKPHEYSMDGFVRFFASIYFKALDTKKPVPSRLPAMSK